MKVGDLVMMDFEDLGQDTRDMWGIGIIVTTKDRHPDDVEVLWSCGLSWEMKALLEVIHESR